MPPGDEINQIDRYIAGSYRLDPFYQAAFDQSEPGVYRLTEIAAARFGQSDYFKSYYALLDGAGPAYDIICRRRQSALRPTARHPTRQTSPAHTPLMKKYRKR